MTEEGYQEFLKTAPEDHFSVDFLLFLVNNNKVRHWSEKWLVIENTKYWTEENDWLTAFYIGEMKENTPQAIIALYSLSTSFDGVLDREWLIKAPSKRSVKLFHVHMYKK